MSKKRQPGYGDEETWGPVKDPRDPRYDSSAEDAEDEREETLREKAEEATSKCPSFYSHALEDLLKPEDWEKPVNALELDAQLTDVEKTVDQLSVCELLVMTFAASAHQVACADELGRRMFKTESFRNYVDEHMNANREQE